MATTTAPEIGAQAPTFMLKSQDDQPTALGDFAGRWLVLYFYPEDDTPGCTTEACEFTNILQQLDSLGATVIGVSPDSSESHRQFIAKYKLQMTLLSDPDHTVMEKYGAWGARTIYGRPVEGVIRSTFLIDPKGRIAHAWPKVKAEGHAEKVRAILAELAG